MKLNEMYDFAIKDRRNLKNSTRYTYQLIYSKLLMPTLGDMDIQDIKYIILRKLILKLIDEGYGYSTVNTVKSILSMCFQEAIQLEICNIDPTKGITSNISKNPQKKQALSREQEHNFLNIIQSEYPQYYNLFIVMFGTGMRIGEIAALTWNDIDFIKDNLYVTKTLKYIRNEYQISEPKTKASNRTIPMLKQVKDALKLQKNITYGIKMLPVAGKDNYVFRTTSNTVVSSGVINKMIKKICQNHPELEIDGMTCHSTRHTFCTRMCENNLNIKAIQVIMGHENIQTTLDVYTKVTDEMFREEFRNYNSKINHQTVPS